MRQVDGWVPRSCLITTWHFSQSKKIWGYTMRTCGCFANSAKRGKIQCICHVSNGTNFARALPRKMQNWQTNSAVWNTVQAHPSASIARVATNSTSAQKRAQGSTNNSAMHSINACPLGKKERGKGQGLRNRAALWTLHYPITTQANYRCPTPKRPTFPKSLSDY